MMRSPVASDSDPHDSISTGMPEKLENEPSELMLERDDDPSAIKLSSSTDRMRAMRENARLRRRVRNRKVTFWLVLSVTLLIGGGTMLAVANQPRHYPETPPTKRVRMVKPKRLVDSRWRRGKVWEDAEYEMTDEYEAYRRREIAYMKQSQREIIALVRVTIVFLLATIVSFWAYLRGRKHLRRQTEGKNQDSGEPPQHLRNPERPEMAVPPPTV